MTEKITVCALMFDFDGVIVDSAPIRIDGFREIFDDQPLELVDKLIEYHVANGGISRYEKIKWFYENLLNKKCPDNEFESRANKFKTIMLNRMMDKSLIISETIEFISSCYKKIPIHIVSGSDGNELREICNNIGIDKYFISIHGSPTPKDVLVRELMEERKYDKNCTVFVGDAINDYSAAHSNGLIFCGYNNVQLRAVSDLYIDHYNDFQNEFKF